MLQQTAPNTGPRHRITGHICRILYGGRGWPSVRPHSSFKTALTALDRCCRRRSVSNAVKTTTIPSANDITNSSGQLRGLHLCAAYTRHTAWGAQCSHRVRHVSAPVFLVLTNLQCCTGFVLSRRGARTHRSNRMRALPLRIPHHRRPCPRGKTDQHS